MTEPTLGRYRIEEELGRGSFSVVYRARDLATGREVALKICTATDPESLARFRREPEALRRAGSHPNVVSVLEAGEDRGVLWIAMELVRGRTLEDLLRERGALPWTEACAIVRKLASAVAHLHAWDLVHRDLKPGNVVIDASTGEPRLLDFGLALDTLRETRMTASGELVGTPCYMAPEQVAGDRDRVGPAADVFALGVVLYELLAGERPFRASSLAGLVEAFEAGPPPPDRAIPGLPPPVASACLRALARQPGDRFATAAQLEESLAAALEVARDAAPPETRGALGPYQVDEPIGRGGTGIVYRARRGREVVAVKVLARASAEAFARFERERRLLGELGRDAGFVPLLDVGSAGGRPFLVMPWLEGGSLAQRLGKGPLGVEESVELGRALAASLARAHARGVVHRDVKPANVLFDARGRPLLADLGLAKHFLGGGEESGSSLSRTGQWLGTPGYMAPEQATDAKSATPRSDVFALAALIWECLAGRPLFAGSSAVELVRAASSGKHERIAEARPEVPAWLDLVLERALRAEPAARFEDAGALERVLARAGGAPGRRLGARAAAFALVVGAAGAFVAVAAALPGAGVPRAGEQEAAGLARLEAGDARGAVSLLSRAVELEPARATAWLARARARAREGDRDGAIEDASRAAALSPRDARAFEVRARALSAKGELDLAIDDWTRAAALSPARAECFRERGIARSRRGRLLPALEDLSRAIDLDARDAAAWAERARVQLRLNRPAGLDYARAIELAPGDTRLRIERALCQISGFELADARRDLDSVLVANPANALGRTYREVVRWLELGNSDMALALASQGIALEPSWTQPLLVRALVAQRGAHVTLALHDAHRMVELDPCVSNLTIRAFLQRLALDTQAALDDANRALDQDPRAFGTLRLRSVLLLALKRRAEALADVTRLCEAHPKQPQGWLDRGRLLAEGEDLPGALADLDRAIELDARSAEAFTQRASVRTKLGSEEGALADLDRAIELDPRNVTALLARARSFSTARRFRQSLADFTRVLELRPAHQDAWAERASTRFALNDAAGAIQDATRAIELDPRGGARSIAWATRGWARARADREGAIADLEQFLRLVRPDDTAVPGVTAKLEELRAKRR